MADINKATSRCLIIFVRNPEPGKVKTRLASVIGDERACALYKSFVFDLVTSLGKADTAAPFLIRFYYHPPASGTDMKRWLGHEHAYVPQRGRNLGARMRNAFQDVFAEGFDRALLIGSDVPDLPFSIVKKGFDCLSDTGSVIGPSHDGGYYLIGFRADSFLTEVFDRIPWSSRLVYEKTLSAFLRCHCHPAVLPVQQDIDTFDDLKEFWERHSRSGFAAPRTMHCLSGYFKT